MGVCVCVCVEACVCVEGEVNSLQTSLSMFQHMYMYIPRVYRMRRRCHCKIVWRLLAPTLMTDSCVLTYPP